MLDERRFALSAPATVHIEMTSGCNLRCRHCYNYWRAEDAPLDRLDRPTLDRIIDELAAAGVFHVILTGGEPLSHFDVTLHAVRRLTDLGFSLSMNSNLTLATPDMMSRLRSAGLGHVLGSLLSPRPETHDFLASAPNTWRRMVRGIKTALDAGLAVTNNMVVSQANHDQVHECGAFLKTLGVKGLTATRVSPPPYADEVLRSELRVGREEARSILEQMIRVKQDFGLEIGALLPFPLCFLDDFDRYADFAGRRCAGGIYTLSLNASGQAHACQKEGLAVGGILEDGLSEVWARTRPWRTLGLLPDMCRSCEARAECGGGCRTVGLGYEGRLNGADNLALGPIARPLVTEAMWRRLGEHTLVFRSGMRFRAEDGFTLLNIRGAKNLMIDDGLAAFIRAASGAGRTFELTDVPETWRPALGHLYKRGAIELLEAEKRAEGGHGH
ncbi:MAG: radical SAM protein [Proteobacteria bacterium]|nr:radical SAM protein [Pseudomonadota bacterium]